MPRVRGLRDAGRPGIVLAGAIPIDSRGRRAAGSVWWQGPSLAAPETPPPAAVRIDLDGHLVFPGLINAHDHLHLNAFDTQAYGQGLCPGFRDAADWVEHMRQRIAGEDMRAVRRLPAAARAWQGALKNLLAGSTVVVHHDPFLPGMAGAAFPVTVPRRAWAHSLGLAGSYGLPLSAIGSGERGLASASPAFLHLAEGRGRPAADEWSRLIALGLGGPRLRLVHGLALRPEDRIAMIRLGIGLVTCPVSNQRLFGHVAPVRDLAAQGLAALGTDSRLTGARDLLAELRFARQAGFAGPGELLRMVGVDAARLCGLPKHGLLGPGMAADLLLLRDDGRPPAEQLCDRARGDLRLVVRRGRPALADPDLAPIFAAMGVAHTVVRLDGRPKLIAEQLLVPLRRFGLAESGLELQLQPVDRA